MTAGSATASGNLQLTRAIALPVGVLLLLAMVVLPLPPIALDILFTFNIALSLLIVLAVFHVARPLDFGVFPTLLLLATILRLGLNVASTRVVLLNGHAGSSAAGRVIESFGEFVIGGNFAVGIVVFAILTIINFVVVTKGAGRISEVSARFTLDAMPGKQMAIDADLNAGLINQDEARTRRSEIRAEADFYGAMDGASKFVRGDATAGILIVIINMVGGLAIGTLMHDLPFADAARSYVLLTIGDGLVAQIPALLLSTAVAIIVTRMSKEQDMGREFAKQLLGDPRTLTIATILLVVLGLIPGMPHFAFLLIAAVCGSLAWWIKVARDRARQTPVTPAPVAAAEPAELGWDDVKPVDRLSLEVGYRLVSLVEKSHGGDLLARVRGVRRKLSEEFGFLIPTIHVRDNLDLPPNGYRVSVSGVPVGEGSVYPEKDLAINPGKVFARVSGIDTRDPAFGMEATWIERSAREHAQTSGYTVVDPATVVATHLSHLIQQNAADLLGHEEVQKLLEKLARSSPKLVEDLTPKLMPMSGIVRVFQNLLSEGVSIRNTRSIVEAIAEHATRNQDPSVITTHVRVGLGRQIVQDIVGLRDEMPAMTLDGQLEQLLGGTNTAALEPGIAEKLQQRLQQAVQQRDVQGEPAVLVVAPAIRVTVAKFARAVAPGLHVLSWQEIPDSRRLRLVATIGAK
ncbi:MAG: flagellar biosynthesis protein FlhA [Steroidobacteraceae bacterium]